MSSEKSDANPYTSFSEPRERENQQREKKETIDQKLQREKREVEELKKREEIRQLRRMKEELKKRHEGKSAKRELLDTIAPPTETETSEDIIEVFTGIGSGPMPVREEETDPFDFRPGELPVGEVDVPMDGMKNLEYPVIEEKGGIL